MALDLTGNFHPAGLHERSGPDQVRLFFLVGFQKFVVALRIAHQFCLVVDFLVEHVLLPLGNIGKDKHDFKGDMQIIGGLIGMADMICFGFCEEVYTTPPQRLAFGEMMRDIVKDQSFMRFTVMWTAWCFTTNLCEPYLSRYSMNEMGLNFTQMTVFGTVAASVGTLLVMRRWGAVLDKSGGRTVMLVAALAASLSNAFYLFSTPGNIWPVMLRNLIGAAFWCGSNLAANSLQLSLAPEKGKASYIAFFSCVTCLAGTALGSMAGGALLETMGSMGWFTGSFDRYKALITLSTILRFSIVILLVPRITDGGENGKIQLRVPTVFTGLHRKRLRK